MLAVASARVAGKRGFKMSGFASAKQVAFIQSLVAERVYEGIVEFNNLTIQGASQLIEALLKSPRKVAGRPVASNPVTEVGMYQVASGAIYRVQAARGTGNLYAKVLNILGGFDYEQGAIRKLSASDKMTLEQAQAFGVATGLCCVCGAFLTDAKSVARGIGPVCAKGF
jgi:hypothetical protein